MKLNSHKTLCYVCWYMHVITVIIFIISKIFNIFPKKTSTNPHTISCVSLNRQNELAGAEGVD